MKRFLMIASLFVFVFLNAANYAPNGTDVRIANITSRYEAMDPMEGVYPETEKIEEVIEVEEITDREMPAIYAPLWADDLLVTGLCNQTSRYNMGFDYDVDGNFYAAIQSSHTGPADNDTMFIYKSTDKGYTWTNIYQMNPGGGKLLDFEIRVQPYTVDPAIYLIWVDSSRTQGNRMYFAALHPGGTDYWYNFPLSEPPINAAMDVSNDAIPFIVIGYITQVSAGETGWYTTITSDTGVTWNEYFHNGSSGPEEVTVACLDDGHFYNGIIYTQSSNRFRMVEYDGGWGFHNVSGTNDVVRNDPCLASQKFAAYPNNYVYGVYSEGSGTASRVYFNYSSDAAQNWGTPGFWGPVGDVRAEEPHIRMAWNASFDRIVGNCALPVTGDDSLVIAIINTNFQTWGYRAVINDHSVTGSMPAQCTYVSGSGINGRVIIYRQYGSDNIWFDRWNYYLNVEEETPNTNIETGVFNVSSNNNGVRIDFSVVNDENIKINVYDFSGRCINSVLNANFSSGEYQRIWDLNDNYGQEIQAGTYFINLNSDSRNITKKITIL